MFKLVTQLAYILHTQRSEFYIMSKLFALVGTTIKAGQVNIRFANDLNRIKALQKDGQDVLKFAELPEAMTKEDAVMYMAGLEEFKDDISVAAIEDFNSKGVATVSLRKPRMAGEDQLFSYVGVACWKGQYKVRWANDAKRSAALVKDGQTDVRLVQLPNEMTKMDAVMFIKDSAGFEDLEAQQAFDDFLSTNVTIIKAVKVEEEVEEV
jgi:hypothetical protein